MSTQRFVIIFALLFGFALFISGCDNSTDSPEPTSNNQTGTETETTGSSSISTTQEPESTATSESETASTPDSAPESTATTQETTPTQSGQTTTRTEVRTDRAENDYFIFERIVPEQAVLGQPYTIGIRILAKQDLALVAYSEQENPMILLTSGQLRNISMGLATGDVFETTYDVLFIGSAGRVELEGAARTPSDSEEGGLFLTSEIEVVGE